MIENSKERFTNRVDDYVKYRPSYPPMVVDFVHEHGVSKSAEIADIGAGTGISTKLFLDAGHSVCAVEPNEAMRTACDRWLGRTAGYSSIAGNAEDTLLPDARVDLVVAAQAFHWFDIDLAKRNSIAYCVVTKWWHFFGTVAVLMERSFSCTTKPCCAAMALTISK